MADWTINAKGLNLDNLIECGCGYVYYPSRCGKNLLKIEFSKPSNLDKYIINEGATILFWKDGTKTISKRHEGDKFDKELGFLFAYFYKQWGKNKAAIKRVIKTINEDSIKTFLFEFFAKDNHITTEQAKKYLSRLEISK